MSIRFYIGVFRGDNQGYTKFEANLSREQFYIKLNLNSQGVGGGGYYFVTESDDGTPAILVNRRSPVAANIIPYFENILGSNIISFAPPITTPPTENESSSETHLCINLVPRETSENYLSNSTSFSNNFLIPRDPIKVVHMLATLQEVTENQFESFVNIFSKNPKVTVIVEEGSPLASRGLGFWNDIFMGELTN